MLLFEVYMRIIGIDPGYDRIGIAVLEKTNGTETLLYSECFKTNKSDSIDNRIHVVAGHLRTIIQQYSPTVLGIELLYLANNQKTAMAVSEARGVIKYIASEAGLIIHEYTPLQIKVALTGKAPKERVAWMVAKLLKLDMTSKTKEFGKSTGLDDELDAIAVALTTSAVIRL
jgi:crossover junction endodeoxyribonuclease RuvC